MPKGQLRINGLDAYSTWGISLEDGSLSALMLPAQLKPFIENKSRLSNGKSVIVNNPKLDERQVTLVLNMSQRTKELFMDKYASFVSELQTGRADIFTSFQDVEYHCIPVSCTQFSQIEQRIGKWSFRLIEYNPAVRDGVKLNKIEMELRRNANETLVPTVFCISPTPTFSWSSSNIGIATVNSSGKVTAGQNAGTALITCSYGDGRKATCIVTVS